MTRQPIALACAVFALACVAGCATDATEDADDAATERLTEVGIRAEAALSALSTEQRIVLCEVTAEVLDPVTAPDFICEVFTASQTDDPARCRADLDTCVAEAGERPDPQTRCMEMAAHTLDCDAEVALYRSCARERARQLRARFGGLNCARAAQVGFEDLSAAAKAFEDNAPSACVRLEAQCPAATGDDADGAPTSR